MKVQPKEENEVISFGCPDASDLQRIVEDIVKADLPIWSLVFINPRMAEMFPILPWIVETKKGDVP